VKVGERDKGEVESTTRSPTIGYIFKEIKIIRLCWEWFGSNFINV